MNKRIKTGRTARCRECTNADVKQRRSRNLERYRGYGRKFRAENGDHVREVSRKNTALARSKWTPERRQAEVLRKYKLTLEQFDVIFESQDRKCALCGTLFGSDKTNKPHVDHDHLTNKVRALLCNGCNTGLGMFKDDRYRLQQAIDYLSKHQ